MNLLKSIIFLMLFSCDNGQKDNEIRNSLDTSTDTDTNSEDTANNNTSDPNGDGDGDGFSVTEGDCDDDNENIYPTAEDVFVDGIDQDCDGLDGPDLDGDNFADAAAGGDDCDDSDPNISPAANDETVDGIDQNCDSFDGTDDDGDGYASSSGGGEDCNDSDESIHPNTTEICDGLDTNCDGQMLSDERDIDSDGFLGCDNDCDDTDAFTYPGAAYNDSTSDCMTDVDLDGYGAKSTSNQPHGCCYAVEMYDLNYGGWYWVEGSISVYINGQNEFLMTHDGGYLDTEYICTEDGDSFSLYFTYGSSFFTDEVQIRVFNATGSLIHNEVDPGFGTFFSDDISCPSNNTNQPPLAGIEGTDCDDDDSGVYNSCTDEDYDGYYSESTDCEDNNPAINPGENEIGFDGIDADCDPTTPGPFVYIDSGTGSINGYACGKLSNGNVECWGSNAGSSSNTSGVLNPPNNISQFSLGDYHGCGISGSGASCWGENTLNQSNEPNGSFTQVSTGGSFSCGIRPAGNVVCWGSDYSNQTSPPSQTFSAITLGADWGCGIDPAGSADCWGNDWGYGITSPPNDVFTDISAGGFHICGIISSGEIECWGRNQWGESNPPSGQFLKVSAGGMHSCGINTANELECWGNSSSGVNSVPSGEYISVSTGYQSNCAIDIDGGLHCWGDNSEGQTTGWQ